MVPVEAKAIHLLHPPQNLKCAKCIIFAVTAVPTQGSQGNEGLGGIGETYFAEALGRELGTSVLGAGKAMRELANQQAGRALTPDEFEQWRGDLAKTGTVDFEHVVDKKLWEMAQKEANRNGCVIVSGKAVSFLKDHMLNEEKKPLVIAIGVSIDDKTATERKIRREQPGVRITEQLLKQEAEKRYKRREDERENFSNAYPHSIPDYSRQSVLDSVHYVFDNKETRTAEQMQMIALNFLTEVCTTVPSLAPVMIRLLAQS